MSTELACPACGAVVDSADREHVFLHLFDRLCVPGDLEGPSGDAAAVDDMKDGVDQDRRIDHLVAGNPIK